MQARVSKDAQLDVSTNGSQRELRARSELLLWYLSLLSYNLADFISWVSQKNNSFLSGHKTTYPDTKQTYPDTRISGHIIIRTQKRTYPDTKQNIRTQNKHIRTQNNQIWTQNLISGHKTNRSGHKTTYPDTKLTYPDTNISGHIINRTITGLRFWNQLTYNFCDHPHPMAKYHWSVFLGGHYWKPSVPTWIKPFPRLVVIIVAITDDHSADPSSNLIITLTTEGLFQFRWKLIYTSRPWRCWLWWSRGLIPASRRLKQ